QATTSMDQLLCGSTPRRAKYTLIRLCDTIALLMRLIGSQHSALRQNYHVYGLLSDTHPGAFTPTLGFATSIIAVVALLFYGCVCLVFWLGQKTESKDRHAGMS